ncbi:MAG: Large-conductance mechanosensitive channel MscMJLR [Methanocella sp. PtaU1.Bin125]|nr:MAG: Large-conductance mechanosensitive channel MscMJLR [Methanocella sp. PtaU1.Bin125]
MQEISNATSPTPVITSGTVDPLVNNIQDLISTYTGLNSFYADVITAVLIIAFFLVLSEAARYFVTSVAPRLVKGTKSSLDDEVLKAIRSPIRVLILLIGVYLALKTLDNMSLSIVETLDMVATIALILVAAYFVSNLINAALRWYSRDVAPHTDSQLDDQLIPFFGKVITAAIYILALLMILSRFGIEITALVASMGVAGIAVALAAQETLSNVFGAIAILTDRPYKVGDRLLIPGIGQGDVTDIGLRSTRIVTRNNEVLVIPNQQMAGSEIINLSMPDSHLRLKIKVGISYKSDVDRACAIMEEIARACPTVAQEPKPAAYVNELGDFAIGITMLVWIGEYRQDYSVSDQIYRQILTRFRAENIEITYPVMTVIPKTAS